MVSGLGCDTAMKWDSLLRFGVEDAGMRLQSGVNTLAVPVHTYQSELQYICRCQLGGKLQLRCYPLTSMGLHIHR